MTVKVLKSIEFVPCKSLFFTKLGDANLLPQVQHLSNFADTHDVSIVIENQEYLPLTELESKLLDASRCTTEYLYVAVNKFRIYSETDRSPTSTDFDYEIIKFCSSMLSEKFSMIEYQSRPDDRGTLGNFIHPVTIMIFQRHG